MNAILRSIGLSIWMAALPIGLSGQVHWGDEVRFRGPCIDDTLCNLPYQGEVIWISSDSISIIRRDHSGVTFPLRSVSRLQIWRENPSAVRAATISAAVAGALVGAMVGWPGDVHMSSESERRQFGAVVGAFIFGGVGWFISAGIAHRWVEVELNDAVRATADLTPEGFVWGVRVTF
jgi:hypothetical protein